MRKIFLILLLISPNLFADTFNLAWDASTTDSTGAPLTTPPSYKLYVSPNPLKASWPTTLPPYATIPSGTTASVVQTTVGKYYAVVTATNAAGESGPSNEISFNVVAKLPAVPTSLRMTSP